MTQITDVVEGAARPMPRSSVRPSWSYEIVTMEEEQDTARVTESNILDALRRRKRSRRQKEATDSQMAADGQAPQKAVAAKFMSVSVSVSMNSVAAPDAMQGRPSAQQPRDDDVVPIMSSKEQETALEGIQRQRVRKLPYSFIRGQKLQHAFSPLFLVQGPQAAVSPITQAPNGLSQGRNWENARPIGPTADQIEKVSSTQEGTLWKSNHVALPQHLSSDDILPTNNSRASRPHDLGHLLNRSALNCLGSAHTPESSIWTLNNVSVSDSAFYSDHSAYNTRSSKQAKFEGRALKQSKTPTSHYFVLTDEPTPSLLDTAVSAISPVVCEIQA
jgi:hypothetical protein